MSPGPRVRLAILLVWIALPAFAFQPPCLVCRHTAIAASSPSALHMNVEELIFSAQSSASEWASLSLKNPTNLLSSLPVMYGAGLLTSFSPCVWGLLPITMSYISTAAEEREDKQTTLPALAFAGGLATVFCFLGIAASTVGGVFGGTSGLSASFFAVLSNAVCLAMGLQLLNLIQLPLPSFDTFDFVTPSGPQQTPQDAPLLIDGSGQILNVSPSSAVAASTERKKGSLLRTFLLGGSSALVASPCSTPVLASILAFVANAENTTHANPVLGGILLLGYTLGYSTPLLAIAATGGQALVRLKGLGSQDSIYGKIAPWVSPLMAGVLLLYGTNGILTALFGDPSLAGLAPVLE